MGELWHAECEERRSHPDLEQGRDLCSEKHDQCRSGCGTKYCSLRGHFVLSIFPSGSRGLVLLVFLVRDDEARLENTEISLLYANWEFL
jgi:hypothetical protein